MLENLENWMYLFGENNFRNGFPYYNQNYRKQRLIFNPIIRNLFFVFILTKDLISYYKTDENYAILMGDWFQNTTFKVQLTFTITIAVLISVLVDITNDLFIKNNKTLKSMISKESNERIPTANKIKRIFRTFERLFISSLYLYFNGFCMSDRVVATVIYLFVITRGRRSLDLDFVFYMVEITQKIYLGATQGISHIDLPPWLQHLVPVVMEHMMKEL